MTGVAAALRPQGPLERLCAALLVSMLLHSVLLFMPAPGARTDASPSGARQAAPARTLDVRFHEASEPREALAPVAAPPPPAHAEPKPVPARSPGSELLPLPAPRYYTTDELTKRPVATAAPQIAEYKDARSVEGRVTLKLWIDERGEVQSAEVQESNLPPKISRTAAEAFRKLRFTPGEIDGRRVRCVMLIEVIYGRGKRPG